MPSANERLRAALEELVALHRREALGGDAATPAEREAAARRVIDARQAFVGSEEVVDPALERRGEELVRLLVPANAYRRATRMGGFWGQARLDCPASLLDLGEGPPAEDLRDHARSCAACAMDLRRSAALWRPPSPSAGVQEALMEDALRQARDTPPPGSRRRQWRWASGVGAAALALVLALALGPEIAPWRGERAPSRVQLRGGGALLQVQAVRAGRAVRVAPGEVLFSGDLLRFTVSGVDLPYCTVLLLDERGGSLELVPAALRGGPLTARLSAPAGRARIAVLLSRAPGAPAEVRVELPVVVEAP